MTHAVKEQCQLAIASIVIHTDFIPIYVCRSYHWGITTIPKNGMLGVTELSYYFWDDIHTSFFTVMVKKLIMIYMNLLVHAVIFS